MLARSLACRHASFASSSRGGQLAITGPQIHNEQGRLVTTQVYHRHAFSTESPAKTPSMDQDAGLHIDRRETLDDEHAQCAIGVLEQVGERIATMPLRRHAPSLTLTTTHRNPNGREPPR